MTGAPGSLLPQIVNGPVKTCACATVSWLRAGLNTLHSQLWLRETERVGIKPRENLRMSCRGRRACRQAQHTLWQTLQPEAGGE